MRKGRVIKERHPPPWIVTYADMITLMFAVFVMLYVLTASETPDQAARKIAEVFSNRFYFFDSGASVDKAPFALDGGSVDSLPSSKMGDGLAEIKKLARGVLSEYIKAKKIRVTEDERGVIISLVGNLYFSAGSSELSPAMKKALDDLATFLATLDRFIRIEGFAGKDEENLFPFSAASRKNPYNSTWQLASNRAIEVLLYLEERKVPSPNLQVLSYGSQRPLQNLAGVDEGTPEFAAQHRRVDIVILTHKNTNRAPDEKKSNRLPDTRVPQSEYSVPDIP